jgi:hypothetical protein
LQVLKKFEEEGNRKESKDKRVLAIMYFRDRLNNEYFWDIIRYLKIDVLMFRLLDYDELVLEVLLFFRDISTSH